MSSFVARGLESVKDLARGYGQLEGAVFCVPVRRLSLLVLLSWMAPLIASASTGAKAQERRREARAELAKLVAGGNPQSTLARLNYLGEQRYAAVELGSAWDRLTQDERRRDVSFVIAGLGQPLSERLLVEFTTSSDSAVRMNGASGLGRIRSKQVKALLPLLEDPSLGVRREAAKALGAAKNKKVGKALLKAAKTEGEVEVRTAMLVAAGMSGDASVSKPLAEFLESSSESTRFAAAQGLVLLGNARGFEFAKKLLGSDDRFVRRQGVALFEGTRAKTARPYLEPMLKDEDKRTAAASARILYEGGDASKLEWLVLASHLSRPDDKLTIEAELERLMLTDDRRKQILKKAGIQ